jgi:DNA-3-methyladenine glycosylase
LSLLRLSHNILPYLMTRLLQSFYARGARLVAADLLGKRLVRLLDGQRLSGMIVEAEAYCDTAERDLACHGDRANNGQPTARSAVMFGPAGHAYIYFTYGMHWMFNIVTGEVGQANAVLIRALEPTEGLDTMSYLRHGRPLSRLTNGPGKLAKALAIDQTLNGANLCSPEGVIWIEEIEDAPPIDPADICTGPRIGLGQTPEPWLSLPWRYWVRGNPFVSK